MQSMVLKYLRWRYGGDVHSLKPPLGYRRDLPCPLNRKVAYRAKYLWWKAEMALFARYGKPMRDAWEASFNARNFG